MAENSKIEWCDHTFNPWEGCVKVSPECDHCYAEARDNRLHNGSNWGKDALRLYHTDAYWKHPLRWDREARAAGEPARVFCGSLCDVGEDRRDLDDYRRRVQVLIRQTPWLRWLLLSKRPQNFNRLFTWTMDEPNVWAGTTVGVRASLWRVDALRENPAPIKFLSIEPLLEDLGALDLTGIHWVIVGGESGRKARPMHPDWARSIRDQCVAAGVPFFFKQWGEWLPAEGWYEDHPVSLSLRVWADGTGWVDDGSLEGDWMARIGKKAAGRLLDGRTWDELPQG